MFTHILIASDGSEHAMRAAKYAAELSKKFDAKLTLITVLDPPAVLPSNVMEMWAAVDITPMMEAAEKMQDAVEKYTQDVLTQEGITDLNSVREVGHPVDMIIAVAARQSVDLIVLGSRGLGGLQSFLLGSVSERVLHHAHCPVLIVR